LADWLHLANFSLQHNQDTTPAAAMLAGDMPNVTGMLQSNSPPCAFIDNLPAAALGDAQEVIAPRGNALRETASIIEQPPIRAPYTTEFPCLVDVSSLESGEDNGDVGMGTSNTFPQALPAEASEPQHQSRTAASNQSSGITFGAQIGA
jgi:hypothetical protein